MTVQQKQSALAWSGAVDGRRHGFVLLLFAIPLTALAAGMGWGIRGQYGHETGAMIAGAFVAKTPEEVVEIGLSEIPADCRLAQCVHDIVSTWSRLHEWDAVSDAINERYAFYQGCHTITNAAVVVLGMLAGEMDFERSITIAVMAGHDTDCNGATVGSIIGAMLGESRLPAKWIDPLQDTLYSAIVECPVSRISNLADRTTKVAAKLLEEQG